MAAFAIALDQTEPSEVVIPSILFDFLDIHLVKRDKLRSKGRVPPLSLRLTN